MKRWVSYAAFVAAAVALDQIVKQVVRGLTDLPKDIIPGLLGLIYVENRGAAFGILENQRWLFLLLTPLALAAMFWLVKSRRIRHPMGVWSLCAVFAGAVGNFIDRTLHGFVVDMFEFQFVTFAIFNIADIFVSVGGVFLCIYLIFVHKEPERKDSDVSVDG